MANKVAVIESEYTALKRGLSDLHQECIAQIASVASKIGEMNRKGGGFYAEALTPKIESLVAEIEAVKSSMESVFDTSENIIESFKNVVADYDTLS